MLAELAEKDFEERMETKCRSCENIRPYPKVLVVLRRLGQFPGAEVYTEDGVSVRFLEMPDASGDGEIGRLTEELIEVSLPKNWRHLVGLPAKRIFRDVFRGVSLAEWLRYTELREAIREIRKATEQP